MAGTVRICDAPTLRLVRLLIVGGGSVQSVDWSPDGERILTGGADGTVRISDADGTLERTLQGHGDYVDCVAWSPDGRRLASASRDNSLRLWDVDGTPGAILEGHTHAVSSIAWSPDGRRLASNSSSTVRLWGSDGTPGPILKGHSHVVWCVAWSPDGRWLASGSHDNTVRLWRDDGTPGPVLSGHTDVVRCVAWSPDSQRLATASMDMTIRLWNADGTPHSVLAGYEDFVNSVAWSPSGDRIASAGGDDIRIWQADGEPGPVLEPHLAWMGKWSPDGRRRVTRGKENTLEIWSSGGSLERVLRGHPGPLRSWAWNADGTRLASGDEDGMVRIWEADGTPGPVLEGHKSRIASLAWSPDGESLASCGFSESVRLWDVDGTPGPVLEGVRPQYVAWSPAGEWLASGGWGEGGKIQLWRADGTRGPVLSGHKPPVIHLAWSPDGQWLASTGGDNMVRIWSSTGKPGPVLRGHEGYPMHVAWSPDGRRLASAGWDNTVRLWAADGTPGPVLASHVGPWPSVAWSTDGQHVVASDSATVSWDADTAEPEWVMLYSQDGNSVKFDAGGEILQGEPEIIEKELVYLIEKPNGVIEILKPSEFQQRAADAAAEAAKQPPPPAVAPFDAAQAKKHQEAWAEYLGVPVEREVDLGGDVKLTMVLIPPGEFMMGSADLDERAEDVEKPQHKVRITKPFCLAAHEVTVGQFKAFVEDANYKTHAETSGNGGYGFDFKQKPEFNWRNLGVEQTDQHPVVNVTRYDAVAFCEWLSKKEGKAYRLPTEAQWEYSCRAGSTTHWCFCDNEAELERYAWYKVGPISFPVGLKLPNGFGLHEIHGNVIEWCLDPFSEDFYKSSPENDPESPAKGIYYMTRGGSFRNSAGGALRSAKRHTLPPDLMRSYLGFRPILVIDPAAPKLTPD